MTQRFGGKYSPDSARPAGTPADHPSAERAASVVVPKSPDQKRARMLAFFSLALLLPGFRGDALRLIWSLAAGGALLAGAWMTREGIRAAEAYATRNVARRPAFPRKIFGGALVGLALALAATARQMPLAQAVLIGLAGWALQQLAFGPDPLRDKGAEGLDPFQTNRVARAVAEAEAHLAAMKDAILRAGDRRLELRVESFAETARQLFRTVESDPGDLTAARKFLSVYLLGARDATVKFADLYAHNRDPSARAAYESLLGDLETTFAGRTTALLADDHSDLDVEIAVLKDRLKFET